MNQDFQANKGSYKNSERKIQNMKEIQKTELKQDITRLMGHNLKEALWELGYGKGWNVEDIEYYKLGSAITDVFSPVELTILNNTPIKVLAKSLPSKGYEDAIWLFSRLVAEFVAEKDLEVIKTYIKRYEDSEVSAWDLTAIDLANIINKQLQNRADTLEMQESLNGKTPINDDNTAQLSVDCLTITEGEDTFRYSRTEKVKGNKYKNTAVIMRNSLWDELKLKQYVVCVGTGEDQFNAYYFSLVKEEAA